MAHPVNGHGRKRKEVILIGVVKWGGGVHEENHFGQAEEEGSQGGKMFLDRKAWKNGACSGAAG